MVVSRNSRPQPIIILTIGTWNKGTPDFGKPKISYSPTAFRRGLGLTKGLLGGSGRLSK